MEHIPPPDGGAWGERILGMVHRRNPLKGLRKAVRELVFQHARVDRERREVINLLDRPELLGLLRLQGWRHIPLSFCEVERGEVLIDSRGEGSFQRS